MTLGMDDFSVSGDLTFNVGLNEGEQGCVTVSLLSDTALEFDHDFTLALSAMSSPPGVSMRAGSPTSTAVTILDNEGNSHSHFTASPITITTLLYSYNNYFMY